MSTSGWIGVDLDGTLARYDGWKGESHIGEPIAPMLDRVKKWLADGVTVKIFTARVGVCDERNESGILDSKEFSDNQREVIGQWCEKHIGQRLPITATKDFLMSELWDDRAVQIVCNTGKRADGL